MLLHYHCDGSDRPVAHASQSLAPAESQYSQLDKEAQAIVFRVKRFYQYLFGYYFTIVSDQKSQRNLFDVSVFYLMSVYFGTDVFSLLSRH